MLLFFNDTATTEIYTLSLHDALPISARNASSTSSGIGCSGLARPGTMIVSAFPSASKPQGARMASTPAPTSSRSEEHTSELQSRQYLVCRLLLEKKKATLFALFPRIA